MEDLPLFSTLTFPEKPHLKIQDFDYVVVDGETRIYFKVDKQGERLGFNFYVTEFHSQTIVDDKKYDDPYTDPNFSAACLFWGYVYWDGLRHLYMGDKVTDTENYLYYASTDVLAKVFSKLRELELEHCSFVQFGNCGARN